MKKPLPPGSILSLHFTEKQRLRPQYSLTAFARKIGVSKAHLSKIFSGKQIPNSALAEKISAGIALAEPVRDELAFSLCYHSLPDQKSQAYFLSSHRKSASTSFFRENLENKEAILRDWYSIGILDLLTLKNARSELPWISAQLGISAQQASASVSVLFRMGFLAEENGLWVKTHKRLEFPTTRSKDLVRGFHAQMIGKGLEVLRENRGAFDQRLITGLTVATTPEKITAARKFLADALVEAMDLLDTEDPTLLYQLNLQFFSLLSPEKK